MHSSEAGGVMYMPMFEMFPPWFNIVYSVSHFFHVLAYFGIGLGLVFYASANKDIRISDFLIFFGWFIFWCGMTHFVCLALTMWIGGVVFWIIDLIVLTISGGYSLYAFIMISRHRHHADRVLRPWAYRR